MSVQSNVSEEVPYKMAQKRTRTYLPLFQTGNFVRSLARRVQYWKLGHILLKNLLATLANISSMSLVNLNTRTTNLVCVVI